MKRQWLTVLSVLAMPAIAAGQQSRVVDEGNLGKTHVLAPGSTLAVPGYPAAYANTGDDVCIALGYRVKPDGTTSNFRVLKAWSSNGARLESQERYLDAFVQAGAHAVSQWQFQARQGVAPESVDTVCTFTFRGKGGEAALSDRCKIKDLAAYQRMLEKQRWVAERVYDARQRAVEQARAASLRPLPAPPPPPPPSPKPNAG